MKKVYFISGLGADKRAFSFLDLSFCEPVFVEWIKPHPHESLKSYALRLRGQIPEPHPVVVGVSFGGMLAAEMARQDPDMEAILIASNKSAVEFPYYLRVGKYFPLYKWVPNNWMRNGRLVSWVLGVKNEKQKELMKQIISEMDPAFLKWAISAILDWNEKEAATNIKHIHGTADKLLPHRYVHADYAIPGGTHMISINRSKEVSSLLRTLIK